MGTDDLFKKRRKERQQRRHDYKRPAINSFLIVTEGARTEPLYFRGIQRLIKEKLGGTVDVIEIPRIDIYGEGTSTGKLIERTEEIINKANIIYQNIWVVFDKDDFLDFDDAIKMGNEKGYSIAWSNQSFEYWLYLHFNYSDVALHRYEWNSKLDEIFRQYGISENGYQKNDENIYELVDSFGGVDIAIKHAKRRMADFDEKSMRPSQYDPGTQVHLLVERLKSYLEE